jgi:uncharacterized membrane protein
VVEARPDAARLTSFVVALIGLGASTYLTVEHYSSSTSLACPETGAINCVKVTTSSWSHLGPVPVALLGLLYFVAMAVLCSPPAWRRRSLDAMRIAGAAAGVASALYLIWVELFRVNAVCLWCTAVHASTLVLLALVLWSTSAVRAQPE